MTTDFCYGNTIPFVHVVNEVGDTGLHSKTQDSGGNGGIVYVYDAIERIVDNVNAHMTRPDQGALRIEQLSGGSSRLSGPHVHINLFVLVVPLVDDGFRCLIEKTDERTQRRDSVRGAARHGAGEMTFRARDSTNIYIYNLQEHSLIAAVAFPSKVRSCEHPRRDELQAARAIVALEG